MSYKTILVMLTILAFSIPTYAENQEKDDKSKIYLLKNSKCRYRKKDRCQGSVFSQCRKFE